MIRVVLFAEVASFYAEVERAQDPALRDRPVVVGGDPRKRGVVQSASLDALAAGVELEMRVSEALRVCPRARAVPTDMGLYRDASRRLMACLREVVLRLEPLGLGAAWFDLSRATTSDREAGGRGPLEIAAELRGRVRSEIDLPLRVGIASGKFLARLAAEESGSDGVRRLAPGEERAFLRDLPTSRLEGVGRKTAAALAELGAHTIGDVAALGRDRLEAGFGTHGLRIGALAVGEDTAPVRGAGHPQSLSRELTVRGESQDTAVLRDAIQDLSRHLEEELARQRLAARRVLLKLRYEDGGSHSRSRQQAGPLTSAADICSISLALLERTQAGSRAVRRIGIQLGRLAPVSEADRQLDLFSPDG